MKRFFREILKNKRGLLLFVPLLLLYSAGYFQRTALPGMLVDQLTVDLGSALAVSGISISFIYIYSLSQLGVGYFVDRFGAKKVVMFGGALFCIGVLGFPFAYSAWTMYSMRMCAGLGAGTMYLSLVRESDRLFGREFYSVLIGIVYITGYAGGMLGTLPFAGMVAVFPWRNVLFGAGVFSLICYIWFVLSYSRFDEIQTENCGGEKNKASLKSCWEMLKNPLLWITIFCGMINFSIYFTLQTFFGKKFLEDVPKMSGDRAAGVIFAMTLVCMGMIFATSVLIRLMGNRRRPLMLAASCGEVLLVALMLCAIKFQLPGWVFAAAITGFAITSGTLVSYTITCQELCSKSVMTANAGLSNMVIYLGVVFMTPFIGWLLDRFAMVGADGIKHYPAEAYFQVFAYFSIVVVIGAVLVFFIPETRGEFRQKD